MTTNRCPHRFDNGFIPTASHAYDSITVSRSSPLTACVCRKRLGDYSMYGSFFIDGSSSRNAMAEEVAQYLSQSPHWAKLMRLTKELGWDDVHRYLATK